MQGLILDGDPNFFHDLCHHQTLLRTASNTIAIIGRSSCPLVTSFVVFVACLKHLRPENYFGPTNCPFDSTICCANIAAMSVWNNTLGTIKQPSLEDDDQENPEVGPAQACPLETFPCDPLQGTRHVAPQSNLRSEQWSKLAFSRSFFLTLDTISFLLHCSP